MSTRSLQASSKGIEKAKIALAQYSLSQNALAGDLGLSRSTVNNFFKRKPIDRENFALICERLGLDIENTVATPAPKPGTSESIDSSELDALVQDLRQKVHANIQKRCGEMRVLDMTRPIDLETIYTDVNILQDITGRQRLDLAELLKRCSLEEFDRLGFAHARTERRSGLEVVEEFDKLMLLGKPGAGKTTFLKRLATLCNAGQFQGHRVPIFITLKDFGDSSGKPRLLSYINLWLKELSVQNSRSAEQLLSQGQCLLLLDGLDEVSERATKQVLGEIQSFSNRFPKNAFVVSCRIAAKEFTFQQFTEVEVADFSDKQIADFAGRWFQTKQMEGKTDRFLEKLKGHPRIQELATNPLLLTLLCLVFEGRTDFPANRSELYEEGLDVLLKKWDGTRSIEREQVYRELSLKRKEDLLGQLAFTTFELGNYFFKQKDAERLIKAYIQNLPGAQADPEALRLDSEAVLKSIESQHGLLVERARGIYSFSHLTFHEYFTARELETRDDLHQALMSHLAEKRWREVFLLTTGMLNNADSLLLLMKSQIDEMLAMDEKLQQFLTWVQQKASSVNARYNPAAIRAFYFSLNLNLNLNLNLDHDLDRILALASDPTSILASARASDLALALALDRALALDHALALDRGLDRASILARALPSIVRFPQSLPHDLASDSALASALARASESVLDSAGNLASDLVSVLASAGNLASDLVSDLDSAFTRDSTLKQSFQELKDQLPTPQNDWEYFKQWWQSESESSAWMSQLRSVLIEYRNIGHNWQFSDTQKNQLQHYYNANKLLVDCLNSDCYVSRKVREEIEESLLLPLNSQQ